MKSIHHFAGCSAVVLAIAWNGCAAEPQKAPASDPQLPPVTFAQSGSAARSSSPKSGALSTCESTSGTNMAGRPACNAGSTAGRPSPFSAEVNADFMKKIMETSAKIEAVKRQIAERQAKLYETNPVIKSTRALMIEGQKEINRILDADPELAELKMNRDLFWTTMPDMPKARESASMPRMPSMRPANH